MNWSEISGQSVGADGFDALTQLSYTDDGYLAELISVLRANPRGLRRWSVMRTLRERAAKAGREITPKFEHDVERTFRRHCAGDSMRSGPAAGPASELFYRPKDKAGEVWALAAAR